MTETPAELDGCRHPVPPGGCRHCGIEERGHFSRWADAVGWHQWAEPTQEQIKTRMVARRESARADVPNPPNGDPA